MRLTAQGERGKAGRGVAALARDTAGNTLALMAAAMIPVTALAGSAIDTARIYVVKVRLQQACDAGVLAGRKFMASSNNKKLDAAAETQADAFFVNNFRTGWMQTKAVAFDAEKTADHQVAGTATATVPMTIMKMFAAPDVKLNVVCEARFDVADSDIMLVLDTTGSMACAANEASCSQPTATYNRPDGSGLAYQVAEKSTSKIRALRTAVLNFYDTVNNNADPTTNLRYGFVSYTSTVNAGAAVRAVSPNYIVNNWTYPSRSIIGDAANGAGTDTSYAGVTDANCNSRVRRDPVQPMTYSQNGEATHYLKKSWTPSAQGSTTGTCVITTQPAKPFWRYQQVQYDTSQFKLGNQVDDPSKITAARSRWQGCLEERNTDATASFDVDDLPPDLDPDLVPSDDATRWRPMWPDVVYYRGSGATLDYAGNGTSPYGDYLPTDAVGATSAGTNMIATQRLSGGPWDKNMRSGFESCGKPVERLQEMDRDDFEDYLNAPDFVPQGGTYHDVGMIWGLRLISPTGLFANDTRAWPGRNAPNRFIIFMTDGDMTPNGCLYGMYGMENYAGRVTGQGYQGDCLADNALERHNARFQAVCDAAKGRNIRVFVIAFGASVTTQLSNCASPGQSYVASNAAALETAFTEIAKQVAMLRVSK